MGSSSSETVALPLAIAIRGCLFRDPISSAALICRTPFYQHSEESCSPPKVTGLKSQGAKAEPMSGHHWLNEEDPYDKHWGLVCFKGKQHRAGEPVAGTEYRTSSP